MIGDEMVNDNDRDKCSNCGGSLIGDPIPEEYRVHRDDCPGGKCFCFPYGLETTHFRREIGIEMSDIYDGVLYWECRDCGFTWPRFTSGSLAPASAYWAKMGDKP